ncbi:hypothetical protein OIU85_006076, partial [Salix viminalis]
MMEKQEIPGSGGPCLNSSVHAEPKGGPIARSSVAHDSRGDKTNGCGGAGVFPQYSFHSCLTNPEGIIMVEPSLQINDINETFPDANPEEYTRYSPMDLLIKHSSLSKELRAQPIILYALAPPTKTETRTLTCDLCI